MIFPCSRLSAMRRRLPSFAARPKLTELRSRKDIPSHFTTTPTSSIITLGVVIL